MTDDEIEIEFERFWKIVDPNGEFPSGVKKVARQCFFVGKRSDLFDEEKDRDS